MLFVVYIPKGHSVTQDTVVGVFLMKHDAEVFAKNNMYVKLEVKEADNWLAWMSIRAKAFGEPI